MKYLITGAAGFIGSNLSRILIEDGNFVVGIDNLNNYYSTDLKNFRLDKLKKFNNFEFIKCDIRDKFALEEIFKLHKFDVVVNLAAQAGVRYSLVDPESYISNNIDGFHNVIMLSNKYEVDKFMYASSSSVYGGNLNTPFKENDFTDKPVSLYAATKKSNELIAETYAHIYKMKCYGLRFFTVYGPAGRPDMAYFSFVDKYFDDEVISIYNNNDLENDLLRDFTFVDDIVETVKLLSYKEINPSNQIFNIGNNTPIKLTDFINTLESSLSNSLKREVKFKKKFEPLKPGDVKATHASTKKIEDYVGFKPNTKLSKGLKEFTDWYVQYYGKK